MTGALSGIRVVQAGEGKGVAVAAKLLRDFGAEVIAVEPPGGSELRAYGPFPEDVEHPDRSGLFNYLNGGKRTSRLDLASAAGRAALRRLLGGADIFLHSYRRTEAAALGLAPEGLLCDLPQLIVTALTPFGSSGPYADWRGYAIQAQAGSGVAIHTGYADREPLTSPLDQAEMQHAGPQTAAATLLALVQRNRTGRGQFVDVSIFEAMVQGGSSQTFPGILYAGEPPNVTRAGPYIGRYPWGTYATRDGHFTAFTAHDHQWLAFRKAMGEPAWAQEWNTTLPRELSQAEVDLWRAKMAEWFRERTNAEIWEQVIDARVAFQPVHTIGELLECDHLRERDFFVEQPGSDPPSRVPRGPALFSRTPCELPGRAPSLADASATIWPVPRVATPAHAAGHARRGDERLPLDGLRVVDLGQVWVGPMLGQFLGDYGADVIIVETSSRPRTYKMPEQPAGRFEYLYRNRRSVELDLTHAAGRALLGRLIAEADILVDNFSPRVMAKLGLPYESLAARHPGLIIATLPAAGRTGPWRDLLTYGQTLASLFGMKSLMGQPPDQFAETTSELDTIAAGYGMAAIMAALHHRDHTGEGQIVEIAQGEVAVCGLAEAVIDRQWNGREAGLQGNSHRRLAPHGIYPCAGDDRWIAIACGSEEEWQRLAETAGHREWLARDTFRTAGERRANAAALDREIASWTRTQDARALTERLQAADVAAFPALSTIEVLADPHYTARRDSFRLGEAFEGDILHSGSAWRFSDASPLLRRPAVPIGADTEEVLGDVLGLAPGEIARYRAEGALGRHTTAWRRGGRRNTQK